ncbi:four-helix bundle copper-binding protein [Heliobacillus mobilis]|uniref:Four-helix bundle copper-binding protein n=1 Tax=Heliobacterium mobile TaxID=28064 RepID=A0A6I3SNV3_HELMO|nr:four-helix bundle copper-binding protein [Heliobacterium mobile]MTV50579.1 four-helix bundle copper-binding protein [Heliobacterium mobile]
MYDHMGHQGHHSRLLDTIQNCEATCEHMVTHVACLHDVRQRSRQLLLLRDCADICGLTAKFVARRSPFAQQLAHVCACICEACGKECCRFPDRESQECAQICFHCARECEAFARGR